MGYTVRQRLDPFSINNPLPAVYPNCSHARGVVFVRDDGAQDFYRKASIKATCCESRLGFCDTITWPIRKREREEKHHNLNQQPDKTRVNAHQRVYKRIVHIDAAPTLTLIHRMLKDFEMSRVGWSIQLSHSPTKDEYCISPDGLIHTICRPSFLFHPSRHETVGSCTHIAKYDVAYIANVRTTVRGSNKWRITTPVFHQPLLRPSSHYAPFMDQDSLRCRILHRLRQNSAATRSKR